jgi:hypothetical protein
VLAGLGGVPKMLVWENEPGIGQHRRLTLSARSFAGTLGTRIYQAAPRDPETKADGVADSPVEREPDAVVEAASPDPALVAQPVQQLVRSTGPVAADQQLLAAGRRDLGDRISQDLDVVGGGVRSGVAGT